jgi:uncharacterized protein (UPF0333 family)
MEMDYKTMSVSILGILALLTIAVSPVACTMHRQRVIQESIQAGGDPIAIKCAIETENTASALCVVKAAQGR